MYLTMDLIIFSESWNTIPYYGFDEICENVMNAKAETVLASSLSLFCHVKQICSSVKLVCYWLQWGELGGHIFYYMCIFIYIYIYIAAVYEVGDGPYWINWENAQVQSCPLARIGARPSKAGRGKAKRKRARKARQGECKTHNYPAKHNGTCL
jgi:hypothetical protein